MENVFLTSLTLPELKALFRNEIENCLGSKSFNSKINEEDPMDLKSAAVFADLSEQTMYRHVSNRTVPHYKKGGRLYFLRSELKSWIKEGKRKTLAELK